MKEQPLFGREIALAGDRVVVVDHTERLQHVPALFGKTVNHLHELPPTVGQAIGYDRFQLGGQVSGERVTHLNRRRHIPPHAAAARPSGSPRRAGVR